MREDVPTEGGPREEGIAGVSEMLSVMSGGGSNCAEGEVGRQYGRDGRTFRGNCNGEGESINDSYRGGLNKGHTG